MLYYKSSLGCVNYYDDVLIEQRLCDPTMLFILGVEAITTPSTEYYIEVPAIDSTTGKPIIDSETLSPLSESVISEDRLRKIVIYKSRISNEEVYKKIVEYFSANGLLEEFDDHVEFHCYGLRKFMNQLTGIDSTRIVPVIFHDINDFSTLGVEDSHDYNEICEKITTAINNAGCKNQLYKKLDIKSMYSYSLGVLFGCTCLGYDFDSVWISEPSYWYDSDYVNLVSSAKSIFSFCTYNSLCCIDIDPNLRKKYHSIQNNKIWNFIYISTLKTISIYKNITLLLEAPEYIDDNGVRYILNDSLEDINSGFVSLDSLHDSDGITEYKCSIVEEDQYGNKLVDLAGNYISWYDDKTNKYWNGYTKMWQVDIPTKAEELPQGEMTLYLVPPSKFWNGNYLAPNNDSTAKYASVTCFGVYGDFTATAKLHGADGNNLYFTIGRSYSSYYVTIYYNETNVFDYTVNSSSTRLDEIDNDYITFSGKWPYFGSSSGSFTYYLRGGLDEDSVQGVALYYEDGTQAKVSDYIPYRITLVNKRIYNRIGNGWGNMEKVESSASIDASKLLFTSDSDGNLLLAHSDSQSITAMRGFTFNWEYSL